MLRKSKISILHYKLRGSEKKKKKKNRVIETSPESAYVIDCDVTFEQVSWFIDQVKVVKSIVKTVPIHNSQYNYGGGYGYGYGSGYYNDNYKPTLGFKPAGETVKRQIMTTSIWVLLVSTEQQTLFTLQHLMVQQIYLLLDKKKEVL